MAQMPSIHALSHIARFSELRRRVYEAMYLSNWGAHAAFVRGGPDAAEQAAERVVVLVVAHMRHIRVAYKRFFLTKARGMYPQELLLLTYYRFFR